MADEELCRRCGICCHEKIIVGDEVIITDIPCRFLDTHTNLCTVYRERLEKNPNCSTADTSAQLRALPADCPYVQALKDYDAPVRLRDHPEYQEIVDEVFPDEKS